MPKQFTINYSWGWKDHLQTKTLKRLQKKCLLCGNGFSIFERGSKYHTKCIAKKRKEDKKREYLLHKNKAKRST